MKLLQVEPLPTLDRRRRLRVVALLATEQHIVRADLGHHAIAIEQAPLLGGAQQKLYWLDAMLDILQYGRDLLVPAQDAQQLEPCASEIPQSLSIVALHHLDIPRREDL